MNYKSLNSAIRSVTNPQPELVKEDYQTRERDRQMANTGQLGSALDSKEKASKKVYGKDGRVEHKSLADMLKKANKKSTVKEEQEYIERLEFALESIAEELELDPNELVEAVRSTVDAEGNHTPGLIRKAIGALGGKRISPKQSVLSASRKEQHGIETREQGNAANRERSAGDQKYKENSAKADSQASGRRISGESARAAKESQEDLERRNSRVKRYGTTQGRSAPSTHPDDN